MCYHDLCNVRLYMKEGKCFKSKKAPVHDHDDQSVLYEEFEVINEIKKQAVEFKKKELREIYDEVSIFFRVFLLVISH